MAITKSVKRYSLSKQVADSLEEMIEKGEYAVGEKINSEVELMKMFDVSRNTIREAVQALTSAGVLEVKQGDGPYVRSSNRFNANMNLKYEQISLKDIKEARNAIEISIVNLAAQRCTEKDLKTITAKYEKRKMLQETKKENTLADIEFHVAIAKASHNKILIDLYQSISSYLENHISERQADNDYDIEKIDALHECLYEAIKHHDSKQAIECTQNILNI